MTLGEKEIFEFKELPFFFRNKRRYSKHVKNVLSVTKKLIGETECNIREDENKKDTKKKRKRLFGRKK